MELTFFHNSEFHLFTYYHMFFIQRKVQRTVEGTEVSPSVIKCDIVNKDGTSLHILCTHSSFPLQSSLKVFMKNGGVIVFIPKNLSGIEILE